MALTASSHRGVQRPTSPRVPSTPQLRAKVSEDAPLKSSAGTPTTAGDGAASDIVDRLSMSSSSLPRAVSVRSLERASKSLSLVMGAADADYVQQAKRLLQDDSIKMLLGDVAVVAAMARQGVQLVDLQATSGLSDTRRSNLLAAVFQDKDMHQSRLSLHDVDSPSKSLQRQLVNRFDSHVDLLETRWGRRRQASERHGHVLQAYFERSDSRATSQQALQLSVQVRDAASQEDRRTRSASREERWRTVVDQGAERSQDRVGRHTGLLTKREESLDRSLTELQRVQGQRQQFHRERGEQRQAVVDNGGALAVERREAWQASIEAKEECAALHRKALNAHRATEKDRLQHRFQLVREGGDLARQAEDAKADRQLETSTFKHRQAQEHIDCCRIESELQQRLRAERRLEREHQRDRVLRAQEHHRLQCLQSHETDSADYHEYRQMKESMSLQLARLAAETGPPRFARIA